jgi:hypothetical protein
MERLVEGICVIKHTDHIRHIGHHVIAAVLEAERASNLFACCKVS